MQNITLPREVVESLVAVASSARANYGTSAAERFHLADAQQALNDLSHVEKAAQQDPRQLTLFDPTEYEVAQS